MMFQRLHELLYAGDYPWHVKLSRRFVAAGIVSITLCMFFLSVGCLAKLLLWI